MKKNDFYLKPRPLGNNMNENNVNYIYSNMNNKNNIDYSKLTKEELIEMMQQKDQQLAEQNKVKHVPKPIKRTPKKGPSQKNMSNETDEMADIRKTNKQLKSELELTTMKYNRLFRKSEVLKYPKEFVSIDRFRKEEAAIASDFKKGSSFVNLFKNRLGTIKGNRDIVSITLYVDITDENGKSTEEKTYGPFETEIPRLNKRDMYKFMVYTLMENKFTLLSAQVISKIGCDIVTHNKEFFMKHKMSGLKLESYLLSNSRKIKSHGENTCVLDYVWDQVRGHKGFKTYDYDKLKQELYSYAPDSPKMNTDELIQWAKECHQNVSIHAYDSTYKKFVTHSNNCSNVSLVYIVKDHHCFPITDEKLKLIASKANHGGAKSLLKYMTDIKWTRRHENVHELRCLEEVVFENKKKCIIVLPEEIKMTEAIRKYIDTSKFYVEYLHWNNVGILDGFIDHNENMYLLNDNYKERKSVCDKMYNKFKTFDFVWTNQSFTSLSSSLFRQMCGYLPESTYNVKTRQILDDYYPRALQWCTTDEIPEDVVSIDISKSYPSILINNNSPIPVYSIHDEIVPFNGINDLNEYGEFYLIETILDNFGKTIKIEAGFYSRNLVYYLVHELYMSIKQIKYKITTKRALKPDTFKCFMEYLFNEFPENEAKRLANSFIGELGRKYNKTNCGFTCTEYETAMCCWTRAMAEGRNVTVNSFNDIFLIKEQSCERIFSDNTSINRFVVSEAILKLLELIRVCHGKDSKLYAYNTDGIFITNPKLKLKRKKDVEFKTSRIGRAYITETELVYFEKKYREDMDFGSYVVNHGNGCIFNGQAGSGKTTKLCKMVKESENPLVLSFTNKAIENIKERLGEQYKDMCHTFDSYFCERREADNSLKSKTIFIDEFSMVPNKWMTKIYEIFTKYYNTVYMFGDNNQCEAVENGSHIKYDYQESASILQMCPNKCTMSYIEESCRYDKDTHNMLSTFLKHGKVSAYFEPIGEYNKNICYLNKTRKQVTEQCCDRFTKDK